MQKREENSEFKVRRDFGEREKEQNQLLEVIAESYMILGLLITPKMLSTGRPTYGRPAGHPH